MSKITKEKKQELEKELEYLKTEKRKEVIEKLQYAKGLGDLSENAEYTEARREQGLLEDRISEIEKILLNAEVVSKIDTHESVVFGSEIMLKKDKEEKSNKYKIIGENESVAEGIIGISESSPIGIALMNKKVGDEVLVSSPKGETKYKIEKIL